MGQGLGQSLGIQPLEQLGTAGIQKAQDWQKTAAGMVEEPKPYDPFYTKPKISLRSRNLNTEHLKVNDKRGNPVEIATIVIWRVQDTAQAVFDVDRYDDFVKIQNESAH